MARIITAEQMKNFDKYTIEKMGVPSMILMEHAALASVEEFFTGNLDPAKVLCICSAGNNGGDGFAIARLMHLKGIDVEILFLGKREKCTPETSQQFHICENYNISIYENDLSVITSNNYTSIIDAIFGIGLIRDVEGLYKDAIDSVNSLSGKGKSKVLAVDIPSGISADTGEVMGTAIKANRTVTFAYNKIGLTTGNGPEYAGEVIIKDIGIYSPSETPVK